MLPLLTLFHVMTKKGTYWKFFVEFQTWNLSNGWLKKDPQFYWFYARKTRKLRHCWQKGRMFYSIYDISSLHSANYTERLINRVSCWKFILAQEIFTQVLFMTFVTNSTSVWFLRFYNLSNVKKMKMENYDYKAMWGDLCGVINKSKGEMIRCQRAHWVTTNEWVSSQIDHK